MKNMKKNKHIRCNNELNDKFPLEIIPISFQDELSLHMHSFTELVIITKGEGIHFFSDIEYPIATGDVFVIHGKNAHGYRNTNKLQLINIIFDANRLGLQISDLPKLPGYHALFSLEPTYRKNKKVEIPFRLNVRDLSTVLKIVDDIKQELKNKATGFECMAKSLFLQVACFLSRKYEISEVHDVKKCLRLGNVFSFLEENFQKEISIASLCEMACMSESSLLRAFKQSLGVSPKQYIMQLSIRNACELIRTTDFNITEISFRCGFTDSNYFSRCFKNITGISPTKFKKHF